MIITKLIRLSPATRGPGYVPKEEQWHVSRLHRSWIIKPAGMAFGSLERSSNSFRRVP